MQDQYCLNDINQDFNLLCKQILINKNLGCLKELNDLCESISLNKIELHSLNFIILYYLYFIWIPNDLRDDLKSIGYLITEDINRIIKNYMSFPEGLKIDLEKSDIYVETVFSLVNDILNKYTNGLIGAPRKDKNLYKILINMFKLDYSTINDDFLKILFIGYFYFKNELFSSVGESELFKFFLYSKKSLININFCDGNISNEEISFEDKAHEMKLI